MSAPDLLFRAKTQCALQEAANLFKQHKVDDARQLLHEAIDVPYKEGKLSKAQLNAVYRSIVNDPLTPPTPYLQKQYLPLMALKGAAIKDLVQFYSAADEPLTLKDGQEKKAILKAAELLETKGDVEGALQVLKEAFTGSHCSSEKPIQKELVKEIYHIMADELRTPKSSFLKKQFLLHPEVIDLDRLQAMALESLSFHLFDEARPKPSLPARLIEQNILTFADSRDLAVISKASKSSLDAVKKSLKSRTAITIEEMRDFQKMGIVVDKETFPVLRSFQGKLLGQEDVDNLLSIILHCPNLEVIEIDLDKSTILDHSAYLKAIGSRCPNLCKFSLKNSMSQVHRLLPINIDPVLQGCKKIKFLDLQRTRLGSAEPNTSPVELIAKKCPDLMSIEISDVSSRDVKSLVENCKQLTAVSLHGDSPDPLDGHMLFELAKCSGLKTLKIQAYFGARISRDEMQALSQGCKALTDLKFSFCSFEKDALAEIGAAKLPLKSLCVFECGRWVANDIKPLAEGCSFLENVRIVKCSLRDENLQELGKHCPLITTLDINDNPGITVEGVKAITEGCRHLTDLSCHFSRSKGALNGSLQALTKSNCNFTKCSIKDEDCPAEEIIAFVRKNPGLTHLNLSSYKNVDDNLLLAIAELLPNITSLDLSRTDVTHVGIAALGKKCPKIKELILDELNKIDRSNGDLLLQAISENFPWLLSLNISKSSRDEEPDGEMVFTHNGYTLLGKGCSYLEQLIVKNKMSIKEGMAIVKSFPHIKKINWSSPSTFLKITSFR